MDAATGRLTGLTITNSEIMTLSRPCQAPAPLVVNGEPFVGCSRETGHEGPHEVKITWPR